MKLSPPTALTWWICLILAVVGVLATLVPISLLAPYAFWLVVIGLVLMLIATRVKGL